MASRSLSAAPNAIWLLYLANPLRGLDPHADLPEGRLFHEWRRVRDDEADPAANASRTASVDFRFGGYWEFLFYSALWPQADDDAMGEIAPAAQLAAAPSTVAFGQVLGSHDFLTLRRSYRAKEPEYGWPPFDEKLPWFTHRHLAQEIVRFAIDGCPTFSTHLKVDEPLAPGVYACTQVRYSARTNVESFLLMLAARARTTAASLAAVFVSLGWEDYLVLWRIGDLAELTSLLDHDASEAPAPSRAITQLIFVGDDPNQTGAMRATSSSPKSTLRLSMHAQLHNTADLDRACDILREAASGDLVLDPRGCLGRDDVVCTVDISSLEHLRAVLRTLVNAKRKGAFRSTSTRILPPQRLQ